MRLIRHMALNGDLSDMAIRIKWTEEKVRKFVKEGRGRGTLSSYLPWLDIREFNSLGEATNEWSDKVGRSITLLSGLERKVFVVLDWLPQVTDFWEQFPLDRDAAMKLAQNIGIAYPHHGKVPAVLTVDFMVTLQREEKQKLVALDIKPKAQIDKNEKVFKNLELHRAYCEQAGIDHFILTEEQIPETLSTNLIQMRGAEKTISDEPHRAELFVRVREIVKAAIAHADPSLTLQQLAEHLDTHLDLDTGTAWLACMQLIIRRQIILDLENINFSQIENLRLTEICVSF